MIPLKDRVNKPVLRISKPGFGFCLGVGISLDSFVGLSFLFVKWNLNIGWDFSRDFDKIKYKGE